jgi:hypothetical protein
LAKRRQGLSAAKDAIGKIGVAPARGSFASSMTVGISRRAQHISIARMQIDFGAATVHRLEA